MSKLFIYSLLFFLFSFNTENGEKIIKINAREILNVNQGSGENEIGVITPSEANPEGPMSFAIGRNEEIYILDQLNKRIQVFKNGEKIKTIPIPEESFKDIELINDKILLLDIDFKKSVYVIDHKGEIIKIIKIEGKLIPEAAEVVEIQAVQNGKWKGIWAYLGNRSVKIADLDLSERERISVPGKISQDGERIFDIKIEGEATITIYIYEKGSLSNYNQGSIFLDAYVTNILGIWDNKMGRIYVGVSLEEKDFSNYIVVIDSNFKEIGKFNLEVQKLPHEIWRSIRVSEKGSIYQLYLDEKKVYVKKFEPYFK
ncbi:MAG: hypothetical protein ABIM62_06510 [candidate division WOR-3 bacterium]